eukprot:Opistho-2@53611
MALVNRLLQNPGIRSLVEAAQLWAENSSGFKKYGLRREDLIMEELPGVEEALERLPRDEFDRRAVRIRMAMNADASHSILSPDQWTDGKKDAETPYLLPTLRKVLEEIKEKEAWNNRL